MPHRTPKALALDAAEAEMDLNQLAGRLSRCGVPSDSGRLDWPARLQIMARECGELADLLHRRAEAEREAKGKQEAEGAK